jgi:hypothetical protein
VAITNPRAVHRERRLVFLQGELGQARAAIAGASVLLTWLRRMRSGDAGPAATATAIADGGSAAGSEPSVDPDHDPAAGRSRGRPAEVSR